MAGTDHKKPQLSGGPAIILVEPQLGENIGTAARAMANCGLDDLRLVRPRDGWPSAKAVAAPSSPDPARDKAPPASRGAAPSRHLPHGYAATARERLIVH